VSVEGIPYHTKEEEAELNEYIKWALGVIEENNSTYPLLKKHIRFRN
jgi:hypothetical protein